MVETRKREVEAVDEGLDVPEAESYLPSRADQRTWDSKLCLGLLPSDLLPCRFRSKREGTMEVRSCFMELLMSYSLSSISRDGCGD